MATRKLIGRVIDDSGKTQKATPVWLSAQDAKADTVTARTPQSRTAGWLLIAWGLGLLSAASLAAAPAPEVTARDLSWLSGCWASEGREPGSGEQWTAPAGGTLLGTARTVEGGRTIAHEFLQIRERDDGGLEFVAMPSGQETAAFRLIEITDERVTFENPEHDFPQRIIYKVPKDGLLVGRIEGEIEGRERSSEFPMRRVDCEALPE